MNDRTYVKLTRRTDVNLKSSTPIEIYIETDSIAMVEVLDGFRRVTLKGSGTTVHVSETWDQILGPEADVVGVFYTDE